MYEQSELDEREVTDSLQNCGSSVWKLLLLTPRAPIISEVGPKLLENL